jgi:integrase
MSRWSDAMALKSIDTTPQRCWTAEEAATFLRTAKSAGPQPAAFYRLALDSGMRKAELSGLKWSDLDSSRGCVTVQRQLLKGGRCRSMVR